MVTDLGGRGRGNSTDRQMPELDLLEAEEQKGEWEHVQRPRGTKEPGVLGHGHWVAVAGNQKGRDSREGVRKLGVRWL